MNDITIDVLFPYYGDIDMMKKAVNSVLAQDYDNWNLKAFDDGFPSEEPERFFKEIISTEIEHRGKTRVTYEKNEENLGANGNFRKALDKASADYFIMMGADDIMQPNFLSEFVETIKKNKEVDIYQPNVSVIDENDQIYLPLVDKVKQRLMPKSSGLFQGEEIVKTLIHGWHYFPAMIWRTSFAQKVGFNTDYNVAQDLNLALDILQQGGSFYLDKEKTTFLYRRHSKSDSSVKALDGSRFQEEKAFYNQKAQEFQMLGWTKAVKAAHRHYFSRLNALSLLAKSIKSPKGNSKLLINHIMNRDIA